MSTLQGIGHIYFHSRCGKFEIDMQDKDPENQWRWAVTGLDDKKSYMLANAAIKNPDTEMPPLMKNIGDRVSKVIACYSDGKIKEIAETNLAQQKHVCQASCCVVQ